MLYAMANMLEKLINRLHMQPLFLVRRLDMYNVLQLLLLTKVKQHSTGYTYTKSFTFIEPQNVWIGVANFVLAHKGETTQHELYMY